MYISWIPNVSGCLSFSNIKGKGIPGRAKCPLTINLMGDESKQFVYSLQIRNLSDKIHARLDSGGLLYYMLSAHVEQGSNDQDLLKGHIYTYPKLSLDKGAKSLIKSFQRCNSDPTNIVQQLITNRKTHASTVIVDFELSRDGVVELNYKGDSTTIEDTFILEAYSFLRDLIHAHKFHRYDDDSIVVPYGGISVSDRKWAERTVKNLHRSIVSTYRNTNYEDDIIRAIGRVSYLESFQETLRSRKITTRFAVNTATLRSSLEAKLKSIESNGAGKEIALNIFVPTFLTLLAFLIGMSQLLQVPCIEGLTYNSETCKQGSFRLPDFAIDVLRLELENWGRIAVSLPIVTALIIFFTHRASVYHWLTQQLGHGSIGLLQKVTFTLAVIPWYGRLLASVCVLIFAVTIVILSGCALRHILVFK